MKIAFLSDFDLRGSGYKNLSSAFCEGLMALGHEVKAIGFGYFGQEHDHTFTLIPSPDMKTSLACIYNLRAAWQFDVLVVALDIPIQNMIIDNIQNIKGLFKYVGIMPIEADPLCQTWAMILLQMDLPLIISHFGVEEAHKANVLSAKYIQLGIDSDLWKSPTPEEKKKYRKRMLNVQDDETFVVLTVADNQERKNLSAAIEAFQQFSKKVPNSKYVLVTRQHNTVGWALDDLRSEFGLQDKFMIMERGMPQEELWMLYAASDCFLLTSKAEGLGLPLLEAMSVGVPCIATDCTGMRELLSDGRGTLVHAKDVIRDPFGNGRRYYIDIKKTKDALLQVYETRPDTKAAQEFVRVRTWDDSIQSLNTMLMGLFEEKHEQTA